MNQKEKEDFINHISLVKNLVSSSTYTYLISRIDSFQGEKSIPISKIEELIEEIKNEARKDLPIAEIKGLKFAHNKLIELIKEKK